MTINQDDWIKIGSYGLKVISFDLTLWHMATEEDRLCFINNKVVISNHISTQDFVTWLIFMAVNEANTSSHLF